MSLCEIDSRTNASEAALAPHSGSTTPDSATDVYDLAGLSDPTLVGRLATLCHRDRHTTALQLAHIGEFEARQLYLPEAFPSTTAYCVEVLRMDEEAAHKRIRAARAARQHPAIFRMVADGRLSLTTVNMLARPLKSMTAESAASLLADAAHKSRTDLELLLAERFPRTDLMPLVTPLGNGEQSGGGAEPALERVEKLLEVPSAPTSFPTSLPPSKVSALSSDSFAVQFTLSRQGHDDLRRAQELLGHQFGPGDFGAVIEAALRLAIPALEKRKYAATQNPRTARRTSSNPRHVPAHVKRVVRERDGGQCTYVSASGRRCPARTRLEFDHVVEVARGGEPTVEDTRLRCRAHNQFTAEQTFGREFMQRKREEAQKRARERKDRERAEREPAASAQADAEQARAEAERRRELDVTPWLRRLGYRPDEASEAAAFCDRTSPDAPLEQRIRLALSYFRPRGTSRSRPANVDTRPTASQESAA